VSTFTTELGVHINWLNWGKVYSLWSSGETTMEFDITVEEGYWLATPEDVSPLSAYKGDPLLVLVYGKQNHMALPMAMAEISEKGIQLIAVAGGTAFVAANTTLVFEKVLVLDYKEG
jgi:hypothetical protein